MPRAVASLNPDDRQRYPETLATARRHFAGLHPPWGRGSDQPDPGNANGLSAPPQRASLSL